MQKGHIEDKCRAQDPYSRMYLFVLLPLVIGFLSRAKLQKYKKYKVHIQKHHIEDLRQQYFSYGTIMRGCLWLRASKTKCCLDQQEINP